MSRRLAAWLVVGLAGLALAVVAWRMARPSAPSLAETADSGGPIATPPVAVVERRAADLFFPGPGGALYPERREIEVGAAPAEHVRALVAALLAGPATSGLVAPLPAGVSLGGVVIGADGTAYLDLRAEASRPPAGGSRSERQMVFSLVNTVTRGVPGVERVVLLWNGSQPASWSGHLDLGRPLAADDGLVVALP